MSTDSASPIPDITGDEFRGHMVAMRRSQKQLEQDMGEIKVALIGNQLGTRGVIPRLDSVEAKTEQHGRKLLVWGSILSASGTALVFLKDFFIPAKS